VGRGDVPRQPERPSIGDPARIVATAEARERLAERTQRHAVPPRAAVRRNAVHLGLVVGPARELAQLAPAIGLAVSIERGRHDPEARKSFGLASRWKPDPVAAEQDRAGRDAFHRLAGRGELAEIRREVAIVDQRHAAPDIAAGEEHEIGGGEPRTDRARRLTSLRELDRDDARACAEHQLLDARREASSVVRRGPDVRDRRPCDAERSDAFAVKANGSP